MKHIRLRSTTEFDKFVEAAKIPIIFGKNVAVKALPINRDYNEYIIAYHEIPAVHKVTVNDVVESSYAVQQKTDDNGDIYTTIQLDPGIQSPTITVWVDGKQNPRNGTVMENPADVVAYLLEQYGKIDDAFDMLSGFGLECDEIGLHIKGIIKDDRTLRSVLDEIATSVGAIWSSALNGFMRLYRSAATNIDVIATKHNAVHRSKWCRADRIANVVSIEFDYDFSRSMPQKTLTVECPSSISKYGRIEKHITALWLSTFRNAYYTATTILDNSAFPIWTHKIDISTICYAGQAIRIANDAIAPIDDYMIINAETDVTNKSSAITIDVPTVIPQDYKVTSITQAIDTTKEKEQLSVIYEDGVATITIVDDEGKPVTGALVWLGDVGPLITNTDGQVFVQIEPGRYMLVIEADGYNQVEMEVIIG